MREGRLVAAHITFRTTAYLMDGIIWRRSGEDFRGDRGEMPSVEQVATLAERFAAEDRALNESVRISTP